MKSSLSSIFVSSLFLSVGLASACSSDDPTPACSQAQTTFDIQTAAPRAGAEPVVVSELQDDALALSFAPTYAGQPLVWFEESANGLFELTADFADFEAAGPGASFRLIVTGTTDSPHVLSLVKTETGLEARVTSASGESDLVEQVDANEGRFLVHRAEENHVFVGMRAGNSTLVSGGVPTGPTLTVRAELASDANATLPGATSVRVLEWTATGAMVSDALECTAE